MVLSTYTLLATEDTGNNRPTVQTNSKPELRRVWAEDGFQFLGLRLHVLQAIFRKFGAENGMVFPLVRDADNGNVTITHRLDLEDLSFLGHSVKLSIDCLEQGEYLCRLSCAAPASEPADVGEHDRCIRK